MPDSIPFSDVVEGSRARNKKNYGDLSGLRESIESTGLIQPIVLSRREDGKYELIAGGRRYATLKKMKTETLYHGVTLDPARPGFIFANEVPEHQRREAELDENLHRLEMDWIDSVLLVDTIHEAKRKQAFAKGERWGQRQTAALLGKGFGKSNTNYALQLAKLLRAGDKDALACKSMTDAINMLTRRAESAGAAELQKRASAKLQHMASATSVGDSVLEHVDTTFIPQGVDKVSSSVSLEDTLALLDGTAPKPAKASAPSSKASMPPASQSPAGGAPASGAGHPSNGASPPISIPLSRLFFHGDSVEGDSPVMSKFLDSSIDHIVTDIPYGIDMENFDEGMVVDVKDAHDVSQNVGMMQAFLSQSFRILKSGGFCVFFYDLAHHEKLQAWATEAGFKVQRWPFIACKTSNCKNGAPAYNRTKNFEVCMYLRKDERTVLRSPQLTSWKAYDFAAERRMYNNPFAKPFALWKDIYDSIALPGQSVLDPYAGEMSACRAAINCGLTSYGIEKYEHHYHRGLQHIRDVYNLIHNGNVKFT